MNKTEQLPQIESAYDKGDYYRNHPSLFLCNSSMVIQYSVIK